MCYLRFICNRRFAVTWALLWAKFDHIQFKYSQRNKNNKYAKKKNSLWSSILTNGQKVRLVKAYTRTTILTEKNSLTS